MNHLDPTLQSFLGELEAHGRDNDAREEERRRKLLNLERPTAQLLQILLASTRRRRVLEIGTSNGYSALWLAATLRGTEGARPLVTVEHDQEKAGRARENLAQAGLAEWVDVRCGSATEVVASLDGPFDCVFFDADRVSAPEQLRRLLPKLERDAPLLADNALSHPEEIAGYLAAVEALPDFTATTVPVGKGLHIAYRPG